MNIDLSLTLQSTQHAYRIQNIAATHFNYSYPTQLASTCSSTTTRHARRLTTRSSSSPHCIRPKTRLPLHCQPHRIDCKLLHAQWASTCGKTTRAGRPPGAHPLACIVAVPWLTCHVRAPEAGPNTTGCIELRHAACCVRTPPITPRTQDSRGTSRWIVRTRIKHARAGGNLVFAQVSSMAERSRGTPAWMHRQRHRTGQGCEDHGPADV